MPAVLPVLRKYKMLTINSKAPVNGFHGGLSCQGYRDSTAGSDDSEQHSGHLDYVLRC